MSVREQFDAWASAGKDQGMEERHWHTAKHALERMPLEEGDRIVDLGTGSGYALRALREACNTGPSIGLDGSPNMVSNAREYTDDTAVGYLSGDFHHLPFHTGSIDHIWSMEAFYYSQDPLAVLREIRRVLRPGGTFSCAVNFFEESTHTHEWQESVSIDMILWNRQQYREKFREAGLHVATQDRIPDQQIEIPDADVFPFDGWDSRHAMVDRYQVNGTLLTVGVSP